jgi:hypothetical protein
MRTTFSRRLNVTPRQYRERFRGTVAIQRVARVDVDIDVIEHIALEELAEAA